MKPINPNSLKQPLDLREVSRMIRSWRGLPPERVPGSVKLIADLKEALDEAVICAEVLCSQVNALEKVIAKQQMPSPKWSDRLHSDVARGALMSIKHREQLDRVTEKVV